ncbi:MAG TPA: thioredoxin domain-containing protein [Gemmatimonadales bacterium]|jgi:protein-disulfide isomerase|nr:thioredoxin domain-containing protein [Gemmatimonadales bacterium]
MSPFKAMIVPNLSAVILSTAKDLSSACGEILRSLRSLRMTATLVTALAIHLIAIPVHAQTKTAPLDTRSKGSPKAPVTVYEMSDFQCPYCRRFAEETFPGLERSYITTGKVRWVFINFPLTDVHTHAAAAAQLALCAAKQNGFWRVHDLLFQYQDTWAPLKEAGPFFVSLADSAGLSKQALLTCLEAPETVQAVQADAEGAARSGAGSTPTFYIEGGLLEGAVPFSVFRQVLDSVYAVKTGGRR